ncbi:MMPL family transporter [Microbacterium sp. cf046]|uniref:MMPL family transporter n=1 Tax=Microbacterium sp. cf046 TaxID=1761803 RepID=UPI0011136A9D|nr:MMPL family transporter [Microbacterium sp. cf046]
MNERGEFGVSSALYALGRWAFGARWRMVLMWAAILLVLFAAAGSLGVGTDNTYDIPGTESQEALDSLARTFPQVTGTSAQLIAVAPDGEDVTDPSFQAAVEAAVTEIATIPQVLAASSPYSSTSAAGISDDDAAVLVPIQLSVAATVVLPTTSDALQEAGAALEAALPEGSEVSVGGQLFSQSDTGISVTELLGIAIAFVVLFITFGSLIAAGLPLLTALLGVGASLAIVLAATRFMTITSTTPLLALMLGLAVGIDYALFILARHQEQLRRGIEPEESAARAVATSGSAVVFAAATVIIALAGLAVAGIPFLTTMGLAAALAVAIAVVISLTLTPALLGFAGWRILPRRLRPHHARKGKEAASAPADAADAGAGADAGAATDADAAAAAGPDADAAAAADGVAAPDAEPDAAAGSGDQAQTPGGAVDDETAAKDAAAQEREDEELDPSLVASKPSDHPRGFFWGWVRTVTRWPIVTIVLIVVGLGALALPAAHLRLALPDAGSLDEDTPGRVTYDLISEYFGPGFNGPLLVMGSVIQSTDPVTLMNDIGAEISTVPGVASVPLATPNETGDTGIVQVISEGSPSSETTAELVATLRSMHDQFAEEYGVDLSVTGYTAAGIDISARLGGALLPFGIVVVGLSLILLAMVFRSIVVPVTAALGYVLSIAAAFGLTTLVFVDGFLAGPLNVQGVGSVVSFMPIILMGVLFGLAMDYEVFLVSRMREHYVHHGDPVDAVHHGFVASARVVTAAATIMFAVFAAFVPEGDANIKPIAFGLAVGVVIDAFIVRMALIPAILVVFKDAAWRMPAWMDRLLPSFDVEGEGLAEELELADWPDDGDGVAIAAERLRVPGAPTDSAAAVDAMVPIGGVLLIHGGDAEDRTALLLALGGRTPATAVRLKVAGLVLPVRASSLRSRTSYVVLEDRSEAIRALDDGLRLRPAVLMLDAADDIADPATRAEVRAALTSAREGDRRLAIVMASRDDDDVSDIVPHGAPVASVSLPRSVVGVG